MNYESKYNELVEAARAVVEGNPGLCDVNKRLGRVRDLLPEKESEDERIRKEIYNFLIDMECKKEWIAYLEKQKEQKYTNSEKPKEWSEYDEKMRLACIATINEVIDYERDRWEDYNPGKPYRPITKYDEQIDWLKSLRNRPKISDTWKPSEDQMKALKNCVNGWSDSADGALESLYNDLKKLM